MRVDFATFCERTDARKGVLVVAPHPDDETLGTGGLLTLCAEAEISTAVVVVTDGCASHPNSKAWPRPRLAERRQAETRAALSVLGVTAPPTFLDLPDAGTLDLPDDLHRTAVSKLKQVVEQHRPGLVLTTWRREPHCDHRYAWWLAREAVAGTSARLAEYAVWTPIIGTPEDRPRAGETVPLELEIERSQHRKRRALEAHASQLGRVVTDDPEGFTLSASQIDAMTGPLETYFL